MSRLELLESNRGRPPRRTVGGDCAAHSTQTGYRDIEHHGASGGVNRQSPRSRPCRCISLFDTGPSRDPPPSIFHIASAWPSPRSDHYRRPARPSRATAPAPERPGDPCSSRAHLFSSRRSPPRSRLRPKASLHPPRFRGIQTDWSWRSHLVPPRSLPATVLVFPALLPLRYIPSPPPSPLRFPSSSR